MGIKALLWYPYLFLAYIEGVDILGVLQYNIFNQMIKE